MELASLETIQVLITPAQRIPARRIPSPGPARRKGGEPRQSGPRRHCQCGECRKCREDARWEQIFAEKFADPTYYARPLTQIRSPLTSF